MLASVALACGLAAVTAQPQTAYATPPAAHAGPGLAHAAHGLGPDYAAPHFSYQPPKRYSPHLGWPHLPPYLHHQPAYHFYRHPVFHHPLYHHPAYHEPYYPPSVHHPKGVPPGGYCNYRRCHGTGDLFPHTEYYPEQHGYFYFRPYNYEFLMLQRHVVRRLGGDPMNPYDNRFVEDIFDRVVEEEGEEEAAETEAERRVQEGLQLPLPEEEEFQPPGGATEESSTDQAGRYPVLRPYQRQAYIPYGVPHHGHVRTPILQGGYGFSRYPHRIRAARRAPILAPPQRTRSEGAREERTAAPQGTTLHRDRDERIEKPSPAQDGRRLEDEAQGTVASEPEAVVTEPRIADEAPESEARAPAAHADEPVRFVGAPESQPRDAYATPEAAAAELPRTSGEAIATPERRTDESAAPRKLEPQEAEEVLLDPPLPTPRRHRVAPVERSHPVRRAGGLTASAEPVSEPVAVPSPAVPRQARHAKVQQVYPQHSAVRPYVRVQHAEAEAKQPRFVLPDRPRQGASASKRLFGAQPPRTSPAVRRSFRPAFLDPPVPSSSEQAAPPSRRQPREEAKPRPKSLLERILNRR